MLLIKKLNQCVRGWGNFHRHVIVTDVFHRVDKYVSDRLWHMLWKRHPNKTRKWICKNYCKTVGNKWVFIAKGNNDKTYELVRLNALDKKRHIKVKADATPYKPQWAQYFWKRRNCKGATVTEYKSFGEMARAKSQSRGKQPGSPKRTSFVNA